MKMQWTVFVLLGCLLLVSSVDAEDAAPLVMAHRGGAHEFEENTMAAFRACYERGIRGFETDVRMTRDGVLVILHDDSLDRTYNATGSVESQTAAELRDVVSKGGQPLLFLEEFLDYFADKPGVYIELEMKVGNRELYPDERIGEYCRRLHELAETKRPESSTYLYTSFDERPLREIRRLDSQAPILLISGKPLSKELIEQAQQLQANYIGCQLNGTSRSLVQEARKQGFKVNCWPGHTVQDYYLCRGLGVTVHCTDIPMAILDVVDQLP